MLGWIIELSKYVYAFTYRNLRDDIIFKCTLTTGAFEGMDSLLEVKLDRNKLQHFPTEGLFPATLHHVEVCAVEIQLWNVLCTCFLPNNQVKFSQIKLHYTNIFQAEKVRQTNVFRISKKI